MGSRVITGATGANVQFAIYDTASGNPDNPLVNTASLSAATSNQNITDTSISPVLLFPGRPYWWFVNSDSTPTMQAVAVSVPSLASMIGVSSINSLFTTTNATSVHRQYVLTYGTWPNLSAASFTLPGNTRNAAPGLLISAFS
jgi:hypothetical protein